MNCKDTWSKPIPTEKLAAYKAILEEGIVNGLRITYSRSEGSTVVEYETDLTHEQVKQALKERIPK